MARFDQFTSQFDDIFGNAVTRVLEQRMTTVSK